MDVLIIILAVLALGAGAFALIKNSLEAASVGVICLAVIVLIGVLKL